MGMPTHGSERPQPRKSAPKTLRKASGKFDTKRFGAAVRRLREDRDIGPSEFASLTGLTRESLRRLESGSVSPSVPTVEKLAELFGLTLPETVELGVASPETIDPKIHSMLGLMRKLDSRSLQLAASLMTALAKHQDQ
ncbi:helix-turn-helix transcriptional regulator [Dongia sp.]|uniref:helix-turn-helix transcriptional regulator n=1 Tax=Dongia sp. TaxID=1977262 RepID=UPI0035B1F15E